MSTVTLVGRARCLKPGCDWPGVADVEPKAADLAARKHEKAEGHPTATTSSPKGATK